MKKHYLIIGGGMTADAAVEGIKDVDGDSETILISEENVPPYDRPPLTKGLWKDKKEEDIWRKSAKQHAELILERRVVSIDREKKCVKDSQGETHVYDKLLIATGGSPIRLPDSPEGVIYFRTLNDYRHLQSATENRRRVVVVGGGFIGSELAAALTLNGREVVMVFQEEGVGARLFPKDLAGFLNDYYQEKGVIVMPSRNVQSIEEDGGNFVVHCENGPRIEADCVVAGLGIRPETELAKEAGLDVDDGVLVDEQLRTNDPDIYAAGDVARFHNPTLGRTMRVEHEDNANTMGRTAGRNMAGEDGAYTHLPFFYSDLFDLGYEAVGETDPTLDVVPVWDEPFQKGVLFYLNGEKHVRGLLFWNVWDMVPKGRELIARGAALDKKALTDWYANSTS